MRRVRPRAGVIVDDAERLIFYIEECGHSTGDEARVERRVDCNNRLAQ